jgi:hypothetical protein
VRSRVRPPTTSASRSRRSARCSPRAGDRPEPETGNPIPQQPSVLVHLPPRPRVPAPRRHRPAADASASVRLRAASQPWRARMGARSRSRRSSPR